VKGHFEEEERNERYSSRKRAVYKTPLGRERWRLWKDPECRMVESRVTYP
jgi:hypothetical protein